MNDLIKELTKVVLINAEKLKTLSPQEIQTQMNIAMDYKKPIVYTQNFKTLVIKDNIFKSFMEGNDISINIEMLRDSSLSEEEERKIQTAMKGIEAVKEIINAIPAAPYIFAEIPEGKSIEEIVKTNTKFYRKNYSGYQITHTRAKSLWKIASKLWKSGKTNISEYVPNSHYDVRIYDTHINYGCQQIFRWELEQLALQEGWDFPDN